MLFFKSVYVIGGGREDMTIVAGDVVAVIMSARCGHLLHPLHLLYKKGLKDIARDLCFGVCICQNDAYIATIV